MPMPMLKKQIVVKPTGKTLPNLTPAPENCKHAGNGQVPPGLYPTDYKNLCASGLGPHTIVANGLYTEADPIRLATLLNRLPEPPKEIPYFCRTPALVFPYRDLDGNLIDFVRVRPHCPRRQRRRDVKYESPVGSECHAYIPVECLAKLKAGLCPVFITEGEKKALALAQLRYCAVAVGGVDGGLKKDGSLVDELAAIPWQGRVAYVTYDWDSKPRTRRQSLMAASKLAAALRQAGAAEVFLVELPPGPDGKKQGVDDFLKALGLSVRRQTFEKLIAAALPVPEQVAWTLRNFREETVKDGTNKDGSDKFKTVRVGLTVREIYDALLAETGEWPKRVGRLLFVTGADDYEVEWLEKPSQTYAWIGGQLPNPLHWADGIDKVSQGVFDAYLRQAADAYEAVESYPHYPLLDNHFYLHPDPQGGDGKALAGLLDFFRPETDLDRSLLLAGFLTVLWGGLPGDRPAFLIESADAAANHEMLWDKIQKTIDLKGRTARLEWKRQMDLCVALPAVQVMTLVNGILAAVEEICTHKYGDKETYRQICRAALFYLPPECRRAGNGVVIDNQPTDSNT
jgi:hypothetical protein